MANETEWFAGRSVEEKHERDYLRRILIGSLLAVFFCWALIYAAATHAQGFGPVALIVIVFSPDGSQYGAKIIMTPDERACEATRAQLLKSAVTVYGKDHWVFSICTKPKALGAIEV